MMLEIAQKGLDRKFWKATTDSVEWHAKMAVVKDLAIQNSTRSKYLKVVLR